MYIGGNELQTCLMELCDVSRDSGKFKNNKNIYRSIFVYTRKLS